MHVRSCLFALVLASSATLASAATPPPTTKKPATDTYHGTVVTDDYRWLEDSKDPAVQEWSNAQNAYARQVLDALPQRQAIQARVSEILSAPVVTYFGVHASGNTLLALKRQPPLQQPILVAFDDLAKLTAPGVTDAATLSRVVLDPNALDPTGGTTIDWYVPSPDGKLIAISLSKHGSEAGDVHLFDAATGKQVHEVVPRAHGGTAGGSLAWDANSTGFYYTRYPRAGERPEADMDFYTQVFHHTIGTPTEKDRFETGTDLPRIAEILLEVHRSGTDYSGAALASVQNGDGGEFIHFLRDPSTGKWTQFTKYEDRIVQATFGPDGAIYMVSRKNAPRGKLLRLPTGVTSLDKAVTIVNESADTIVDEFFEASNLLITDRAAYVTYQLGGPSEVRAFSLKGEPLQGPSQPPVGSVGGLTNLGKTAKGDRILYYTTSLIQPGTWSIFDSAANTSASTALSTQSPFSFDAYEVVREMATSKDGTKVPVNIIRRKGTKLDGSTPTLVYGYGGYGVNMEPDFRPVRLALLEQGFVWALANIRGGGEYGEAWHLQGNLTKKQNVFDDFAAACKFMIDQKYTTPQKLAIEGGSNGGLLMGAMLTQHPEMFKAVVSHVGLYDMLRVELSPNGAFNVPEFGTVKNPEHFKALFAYSPYHNVRDNTPYPATLMLTGANDPRVDPMQSRKMVARLQAATSNSASQAPILLRTSGDSGHGMGTPLKERIAQAVDVQSFLFNQLGVTYKPQTK